MICLESPDHHTDVLALRRHHTSPWCPEWSFLSVSCWRASGTMILFPLSSRPSPIVISPRNSQYALEAVSVFCFSGHPSRQYLRRVTQTGSSDWVVLYFSSLVLLAGKWSMALSMQSSASSCWSVLSADVCSVRGALESVSAVYSSLPGTC